MSQINRVPWGLQSLLGSKNFGRNPSQLVEAVQPTLDMSGHLSYELLKGASVLNTVTAAGQVAQLTVPDNEAWHLLSVSGRVTNASIAECYEVALQCLPRNAGATTAELGVFAKQSDSTRAVGSGLAVHLPQPIILGPGGYVRASLIEAVVTSFDLVCTCLYYKLEV